MEFTLKEFESLNYYSNDSMEKIVKSIVNETSNAVLVNMYEDSLILLDHEDGQFYTADYKFDPSKLTLKIENFEEVQLIREADEFRTRIDAYFEDDEMSPTELAEAYKEEVLSQEKYLNELINDAMITKDFSSIANYGEMKSIKEEVGLDDLESESFFKEYKERLNTHPLTEAYYFDWENPVTVSLVETEKKKLVNATSVERANELWKKTEFKESFESAAKTLIEDVEEGTEAFKELFEDYPQVFFLDSADRKTMFGKTILGSADLNENMDLLIKGMDLLFEKFDLADMKEEYLNEAKKDEEEEDMGGEDEAPPEDEEEPDEKPAKEVEPDDKKKLIGKLKKFAAKIEDEKLKTELEEIISGDKVDEGTRPETIKKIVRLLTL